MYQLQAYGRPAVFRSLVTIALFLALAAGCNDAQRAGDPAAQATIGALATSNAQMSTQVAELSAAVGIATPTPRPPAEPTAAPDSQLTLRQQDASNPPASAAGTQTGTQSVDEGPLPNALIEI